MFATVGIGEASGFGFAPTHVVLVAGRPAGSVVVTNTGDQPLRLEVDGFSWTDAEDGTLVMAATQRLLVFPELITVAPKSHARIRVAITGPPPASEESYKLAIAEIPAFDAPVRELGRSAVIIRTRALVPVYFSPLDPRPEAKLVDFSLAAGTLSVSYANSGNVHVLLADARITGLADAMRSAFSDSISESQLLAGEHRTYRIVLTPRVCSSLRTLSIATKINGLTVARTIPVAPHDCTR